MTEKKLTPRQRLFIEAYLRTWNASEAARQAGFKGEATVTGTRLLANASIQAGVKARMAETSMQTDEVIKRFTDQASFNPADFFIFEDDPDTGELVATGINWRVFRERGHLVKKLSYDRKGRPVLEFHDSQRALELIGKSQAMFVERVDNTHHVEESGVTIYIPDNDRGDNA